MESISIPSLRKLRASVGRATVMILSVVVLLLLGFAYGGNRRTQSDQSAARDAGLPKSVTPATQAASEFMQATPAGTVPMALRPPDAPVPVQTMISPCGADPKTGQPYRFNPQTGQPCDGLPQERVVVRQPNAIRTPPVALMPVHEETPEERRFAAAYQREQEAIQAPTSVRNSAASSLSPAVAQPASNDLSQVDALSHALGARQGGDSATPPNGQALENDYDSQNMQARKEAFIAANRAPKLMTFFAPTAKLRSPATKSKRAGRFQPFSNSPSTRIFQES